MLNIKEMTVQDLKQKLDDGAGIKLVDVREPNEYEVCQINGSTLIPLSEFQNRAVQELKPDQDIVVHCHHGGRSYKACEYLIALGFKNVTNVKGGIHAWAVEIDDSVKQY